MKRIPEALLAALASGLCLVPVHASGLRQRVDAYRATHETEILSQLDALTRLPSVAARPQALVATADRLEHELRIRGFETAQNHGSCREPSASAR